MQHLGTIRGKQVYYTKTAGETMPKNYLALVLANRYQSKTHAKTLEAIVNNDPLFVYCCCSNFTDMEDAVADLLCEKYPGFDDDTVMPMTFAGNNPHEALEFCVNDAFHEEKEIEHIVITDLGTSDINEIKKLLAG